MAATLDAIDDRLARWIAAQPMFFVATAPLAADGHVTGTVHLPGDPAFDELSFDAPVGAAAHRAVVRVQVSRIVPGVPVA